MNEQVLKSHELGAERALECLLKMAAPSDDGMINPVMQQVAGNASFIAGDWNQALKVFMLLAELSPERSEVWANLAAALLNLGRYQEAWNAIDKALALNPNSDVAIYNLALIAESMDELQENVLSIYKDAVDRKKESLLYHWQYGMALLRRGMYVEGWQEYGWREQTKAAKSIPIPFWKGEELHEGMKVVVWMEQGVGDELLTCTMFKDLIATKVKIVVYCSERLVPLFQRSFPSVTFYPRKVGMQLVNANFQMTQSELGMLYRKDYSEFPKDSKCLVVDEALRMELRIKLEDIAKGKRIIGVSWRSDRVGCEKEKSIPFYEFALLFNTFSDAIFVNLQYGKVKENETHPNLYNEHGVDCKLELDEFAALVAACDEVITISNTTAHFAGALGVNCTVLVPKGRTRLWYWGMGGKTPWYNSVKVVIQKRVGEWYQLLYDLGPVILI